MSKLSEASIFFASQVVTYGIICVNTRSIAEVDYTVAVTTDVLLASVNFAVIRRIAANGDKLHNWIGYVLGSAVGTMVGIKASTLIL